jgi:hypothetical protein
MSELTRDDVMLLVLQKTDPSAVSALLDHDAALRARLAAAEAENQSLRQRIEAEQPIFQDMLTSLEQAQAENAKLRAALTSMEEELKIGSGRATMRCITIAQQALAAKEQP